MIGPEALRIDSLSWQSGEVAEGDTARLAIVAANWRLRGVDLAVERLTSGGARVELPPDTLGLPSHVALSGDTTWVVWASRWLAEEPDTTRLMRVVVRTADASAVAEPLAVIGPERPLYVLGLEWESERGGGGGHGAAGDRGAELGGAERGAGDAAAAERQHAGGAGGRHAAASRRRWR